METSGPAFWLTKREQKRGTPRPVESPQPGNNWGPRPLTFDSIQQRHSAEAPESLPRADVPEDQLKGFVISRAPVELHQRWIASQPFQIARHPLARFPDDAIGPRESVFGLARESSSHAGLIDHRAQILSNFSITPTMWREASGPSERSGIRSRKAALHQRARSRGNPPPNAHAVPSSAQADLPLRMNLSVMSSTHRDSQIRLPEVVRVVVFDILGCFAIDAERRWRPSAPPSHFSAGAVVGFQGRGSRLTSVVPSVNCSHFSHVGVFARLAPPLIANSLQFPALSASVPRFHGAHRTTVPRAV